MAETERTIAELQAALADNTIQAITPSNIRDVVATIAGGYAGLLLTISGSGAVKSSVGQTPLIITEYNFVTAQSSDVNSGGTSASEETGKLTVGQTGLYWVSFFASLSSSSNNMTLHFQPFISDSIGLVEVQRRFSQSTDIGNIAMGAVVPYTEGDIVDMRVFANTGTTNITFLALGFSIHRVG